MNLPVSTVVKDTVAPFGDILVSGDLYTVDGVGGYAIVEKTNYGDSPNIYVVDQNGRCLREKHIENNEYFQATVPHMCALLIHMMNKTPCSVIVDKFESLKLITAAYVCAKFLYISKDKNTRVNSLIASTVTKTLSDFVIFNDGFEYATLTRIED